MIEYESLKVVNKPYLEELKTAFSNVLESGWYILGSEVKRFEEDFATYHSSKYCIGVANGLDAMVLALLSFNFEKDSEVIVPSNTYIATILAVLQAGLKPVLVEPELHTYNIDPAKIEAAINSKTRAILVVHLYGKSCEMDTIASIANKHQLVLLEDCAQSHGATYKGQLAGTFGDYGCFSFYPTKNLGAIGDAGAVICNKAEYNITMRRLRNYGSDVKYYNEIVGHNSRLDEVQAALLSVKLKYMDGLNAHKKKLAAVYQQNLKDDFIKPFVHADYSDVYHIYNVRHPKRDELKAYLLKQEIKTEIHYPVPPHQQKAMKGIILDTHFPVSEEIHATTLSLPCSFGHTEADIYKVVEVMNKF